MEQSGFNLSLKMPVLVTTIFGKWVCPVIKSISWSIDFLILAHAMTFHDGWLILWWQYSFQTPVSFLAISGMPPSNGKVLQSTMAHTTPSQSIMAHTSLQWPMHTRPIYDWLHQTILQYPHQTSLKWPTPDQLVTVHTILNLKVQTRPNLYMPCTPYQTG